MRITILSLLLCLAALVAATQYNRWHKETSACMKQLHEWGYTEVRLGNDIENLCGDGLYSVSFKALDKKGRRVSGGICCVTE